jgi:hypothetical protein
MFWQSSLKARLAMGPSARSSLGGGHLLKARNHWLENELQRVERHNLNILKELIELRKAAATLYRHLPGGRSGVSPAELG